MPSHQKCADNALSARVMVKAPRKGWTNRNCGKLMHCGTLPNGQSQDFYFPADGPDHHPTMPGWFKGMEQIIQERGLWPEGGLPAQCGTDFKCAPGCIDCCCQHILYLQPDFVAQKSQLEELIEQRHHLCDFYPKYHLKLACEMEATVRDSLDGVPILQIQRFANQAARFVNAYREGLSGVQAAWANKKYHGHRTLPPESIFEAKEAIA